jgi:endogenous inhibitor of DNA gyrase (YacG/DUF329 family)
MIVKVIQGSYGKTAHCICDKCGKEFKKAYAALNAKNHYCSRKCSGSGRPEVIPDACIICHKPIDNTFYDKSETRPICSKACYSIYFDNCYKRDVWWERKCMPRNVGNNVSMVNNKFYKQGRLILADYNLGVW